MENNKEYLYYLRAVAIIAVVLLHVAASSALERMDNISIQYWWIQNSINALTRWCVPIFFMISGALLLTTNSNLTITKFLKKRFCRILIPAFTFGVGYLIFDYICYKQPIELLKLIQVGPKWHMWFVYAMIPVYMIAPILGKMLKSLDKREMIYLVITMIGLTSGIDFLNIVFKLQFNYYIALPVLCMFLIYFILGYVIQSIDLSKKIRITIYLLGIMGYIITIFGTYKYTLLTEGNLNTYFYNYTTLNIVFMSIGVMVWFKQINLKKIPNCLKRIGQSIAKESYTIYLIHVMILEGFRLLNFSIYEEAVNPFIRIPVMTVLIFSISYIISLILHKIPIIKNLV